MYRVPKNDLDTSDEDTEEDEVVDVDTEEEEVVKDVEEMEEEEEYASTEETIPKSKSLIDKYDQLCSKIQEIYDEHSDGWYNNRKDSIRDKHIWLGDLVKRLDEYEPKLERVMRKMNRKGLDTSRGDSLL